MQAGDSRVIAGFRLCWFGTPFVQPFGNVISGFREHQEHAHVTDRVSPAFGFSEEAMEFMSRTPTDRGIRFSLYDQDGAFPQPLKESG